MTLGLANLDPQQESYGSINLALLL